MGVPNIIGQQPGPRFYAAGTASSLGVTAPENRLGQPVRTWARSLAGMQKEAVVLSGATGQAWRLVSDEGPYLAGYDEAPFPLAFLSTGMVCSYADEIRALAASRGVAVDELELTLENRYTMEGSALRGTMIGGALPPRLETNLEPGDETVRRLLADAVTSAPVHALVSDVLPSRFSLRANGEPVPVGEVREVERPGHVDAETPFDALTPPSASTPDLVRKIRAAEELHDAPGGVNSSLKAEQSRTLRMRAHLRVRPDGLYEVDMELISPVGSHFRLWSAGDGSGGSQSAPDALTYASAGLAFCYMTQLGRYANITKKPLEHYELVQDTHFSRGPSAGRSPDEGATAVPVETHVTIDSTEGEEFARTLVDVGERTCFLHALCRTELDTETGITLEPAGR